MKNLCDYICESAPKTDDAIYYFLAKHRWEFFERAYKSKKAKRTQANYRKKYNIDPEHPREGYIRWAKRELYPIEPADKEVIPRKDWDLDGICGETKKQIDHPHFERMRKWLFSHHEPKHDILVVFPCSNIKPYFEHHVYKWYIDRYKTVCDFAYVSNPGIIPNEYANYYPYRYYEWEEREEDHHKDEDGNDVQGPLMDYYDETLQERFVKWVKHFGYKRVLICCPNPYVEQFALNAEKENDGGINKRMTILTSKEFLNKVKDEYGDAFNNHTGMIFQRMLNLNMFKAHFHRAVRKELNDKEKEELENAIADIEWKHNHKTEGSKKEKKELMKELRDKTKERMQSRE